MSALTQSTIWKSLHQHAATFNKKSITALFAEDPNRFNKFSLTEQQLTLDYSKNPITEVTLHLLSQLAECFSLNQHIQALFSGKCVNNTQQLPALHTALRDPRKSGLTLNGEDIRCNIHATLDKMQCLVEQIHSHRWRGVTGKTITDIVNIGIGGSDLGPLMAVYALKAYQQIPLQFHFIANIDNKTVTNLLEKINLETTLFIIATKSFSTCETLLNAASILKLFQEKWDEQAAIKQHFFAVTSQTAKAIEFGIDVQNIFPIWDWVGGRYSLWSAVGLPIALAIGMTHFRELLRGGNTMDQHFFNNQWTANMPTLLGLLGIWQVNFFQSSAHAILPYDTALKYFPAYLQQLEMESNGKSIRLDGEPVDYATCPIIFGEIGLNAQHAFYQLLHQGTSHFSADFILTLRNPKNYIHHHQYIIASALSQSKAFIENVTIEDMPFKTLPGNHANNVLALTELTPFTLGMLIALYEHKVFVQSVIWQINPFDQWGVEYGKQLSKQIYAILKSNAEITDTDSSTRGLIHLYQTVNNEII